MNQFQSYQELVDHGYEYCEVIQDLWNGYGQLFRLQNQNGDSLIAKHIHPPSEQELVNRSNQRLATANSFISHQRKLKSYQVELNFYRHFAHLSDTHCKVPSLISAESKGNEHLILLEDLTASGFSEVQTNISEKEVRTVLKWLANFHATFLNSSTKGLWSIGTYWNLSTRTEEFKLMKECTLKKNAELIDRSLNNCRFQTLVHGDAKLANFCFNEFGDEVAAVDFQYVGRGCGMKDVIYFLGSCLSDNECQEKVPDLLDYYFKELSESLVPKKIAVDIHELEKEWRGLYSFAWADFHRFLLGWMPTHQKLTRYSQRQVDTTVSTLKNR